MNEQPTTKPIPTRFKDKDCEFLQHLSDKTGFTVSELVRRSVRLMRLQMQLPNAEKVILSLVA